MTSQEIEDLEKYKNCPEGSLSKKGYDRYYISFEECLAKYYAKPDLSRWEYWTSKFVKPLFDGTSFDEYWTFLQMVKPSFSLTRLNCGLLESLE